MDYHRLDIRYFIHDKMIGIFVTHIIGYIIGTYIDMFLNVCQQTEVASLTRAITPNQYVLS